MDDIKSIPCVSVLQSEQVSFKYNLCDSVIQNGWMTLSPFYVSVVYKSMGENQMLPMCWCYTTKWMGDIESILCDIVLHRDRPIIGIISIG